MAALYLSCSNCLSRSRVERVGDLMRTNNSFHCPFCGGPTRWSQDLDTDYWYCMAEAFGLTRDEEGVRLVKDVYKLWDTSQYSSFRHFWEASMEVVTS